MIVKEIEEKIITGSRALFSRYGIKSISMDDIARHLSISKRTIYQFFVCKDSLVYKVCQQHLSDTENYMLKLEQQAGSAIEELIGINEYLKKELLTLNPSLLYDMQKYHRKSWDMFLEHKRSVLQESVRKTIIRGMAEGSFRTGLNADILAILRMEVVQLAFNPDIFAPSKFDFAQLQLHLLDHFIRGLLTPAGLQSWENALQAKSND